MNIDKLVDHFTFDDQVTKIGKTFVTIQDKKMSRKAFLDSQFTYEVLQKCDAGPFIDLSPTEKKEVVKEILDRVQRYDKDRMIEKFQDKKSLSYLVLDTDDYLPILDVKTAEYVLYSKHERAISTHVSFEAYKLMLSPDEKNALHTATRPGHFIYDPYDLSTLTPIKIDSQEILKVNLYVPPAWRLRTDITDAKCPERITDLLNHLFKGDKETIDFFKDWLYLSIVSRNETYMVLNGAKGIGKGLLSSLVKMIAGRGNYTEAPDSVLNTQFNAPLDYNRVISFDEVKVGKKEHSRLKRIINKHQAIEKKGKDAERERETFNSFLISNNDLNDMYMEPDDRRFSVPELTTKLLRGLWNEDELEKLAEDIENCEEMAAQFGWHIYSRGLGRKIDSFKVLKGERFWELCYNSLPMWQRFFVDTVLEGKEATLRPETMSRLFKKDNPKGMFPRRSQRFLDFFSNYLHRGEHKLGEWVKDKNGWKLEVNEVFLINQPQEEESEEEFELTFSDEDEELL